MQHPLKTITCSGDAEHTLESFQKRGDQAAPAGCPSWVLAGTPGLGREITATKVWSYAGKTEVHLKFCISTHLLSSSVKWVPEHYNVNGFHVATG